MHPVYIQHAYSPSCSFHHLPPTLLAASCSTAEERLAMVSTVCTAAHAASTHSPQHNVVLDWNSFFDADNFVLTVRHFVCFHLQVPLLRRPWLPWFLRTFHSLSGSTLKYLILTVCQLIVTWLGCNVILLLYRFDLHGNHLWWESSAVRCRCVCVYACVCVCVFVCLHTCVTCVLWLHSKMFSIN